MADNQQDMANKKLPLDSSDAVILASIFGVAFLLRLIYLFEISASPFFENLMIDCARYSDWAKEIAAGNWAGDRTFYQSPLYAYFLGVVYRFITTDLFAVRLLQALIGSGSCVLVFLITRRLFDRRSALLAGILAAVFAPFIYYDAMIMKTVLSIFFAALGLLLTLRALDTERRRTWLACGAAWGAAALVRENYLLVAAAFAVWYFLRYLTDRQVKLKPLWFYAAGLALVILPVTIRNAAVGGDLALVTSQGGQNFYIGNNPANRTGAYEVPDFVIANPYWEERSFREFAEKTEGRKLSAGEVSAFYRKQALDWFSENPGQGFVLLGKKFLLFFNNYEVADNQSIYFMERYSSLLWLNFLRFGLVAPLGILGLILLWRRRSELAPLYIFAIIYAASVIPFFIFGRYRLPVILPLLPCAAFTVFWIVERIKQRELKILLKPAIVLACLFVFAFLPAYGYHDEVMAMRFINLGQVHVRLAKQRQAEGKPDRAIEEYKKALDAYAEAKTLLPAAAEPNLYAARALKEAGMFGKTERQYRIAIRKAPRLTSMKVEFAEFLFNDAGAFFEAYEYLGAVLKTSQQNEDAKDLYNRVNAALADRDYYLEVLEEKPDDIWALTYLGIAHLLNREQDEAFAALNKALKLKPDYIPANNAMALMFLHIQNHDGAETYARRVRALGGKIWNTITRELESCDLHDHDLGEEHGHEDAGPGRNQ
jgi:4-amino-4-deoxy-L-arabinose transferase-like glycosyltransferase/cytochrome c-type biogenesis protein CcmH/NrfG